MAELLPGDVYRGAEPDPLRTVAVSLTQHMNTERLEDVMRIWWVLFCMGASIQGCQQGQCH